MSTYKLTDKSETFRKLTKAIRDQINAIDPDFQVTEEDTWYTLIKSQHEGKNGRIGYQLRDNLEEGGMCTTVIYALDKLRYRYLPNFDDAFCEKLLDLMTSKDVTAHKGRPTTVASTKSQALFNAEVLRLRGQGHDI